MDDEDKCIKQYQDKFGAEHILLYNKDEQEAKTDMMDAGGKRGITVFVRNACFDLAKKIGVQYFMELDEDYNPFVYRIAENGACRTFPNYDLKGVLEAMLKFYIDNKNIVSLCMGQSGDMIGGLSNARFKQRLIRKAMNSFICDVNRPFKFFGRMNDDVNVYCKLGNEGKLFLSIMDCLVDADPTQKHNSGMTEIYKDNGTYRKSFYSVMCCPSFVKINMMGETHLRIHHMVKWNNAVPKILSERFKKK